MRPYLLCWLLFMLCTASKAEWVKVAEDNPLEQELYLDLEGVKQSGPMAIYRQLRVLTQSSPQIGVPASMITIYEYDCMNSKVRILDITDFEERGAKGEKAVSKPVPSNLRGWGDLPKNYLGKKTIDLLCPGGS